MASSTLRCGHARPKPNIDDANRKVKSLDSLATLCANRSQGLSRALLMEYRAAMLEKKLSASTVNVRLSAVRKLVGEAQRNGIIDAEEAANLAGVPNLSQKGTRLGNC
jgi:hypothetical protein